MPFDPSDFDVRVDDVLLVSGRGATLRRSYRISTDSVNPQPLEFPQASETFGVHCTDVLSTLDPPNSGRVEVWRPRPYDGKHLFRWRLRATVSREAPITFSLQHRVACSQDETDILVDVALHLEPRGSFGVTLEREDGSAADLRLTSNLGLEITPGQVGNLLVTQRIDVSQNRTGPVTYTVRWLAP